MQRMSLAIQVDRAACCNECLGEHLPTEYALALLPRASAAEQVDFEGLEVQELEESFQGVHVLASPALVCGANGGAPAETGGRSQAREYSGSLPAENPGRMRDLATPREPA